MFISKSHLNLYIVYKSPQKYFCIVSDMYYIFFNSESPKQKGEIIYCSYYSEKTPQEEKKDDVDCRITQLVDESTFFRALGFTLSLIWPLRPQGGQQQLEGLLVWKPEQALLSTCSVIQCSTVVLLLPTSNI